MKIHAHLTFIASRSGISRSDREGQVVGVKGDLAIRRIFSLVDMITKP